MMRVGLLGFGYMGTIRLAALRERDDCEVVRIFHTSSSGVPMHAASWEEVVRDPAIDAVFVCLPNDLTRDVVCAALAEGKHVFAEKPPGTSVDDVRAMQAAASGRVLKFGFNHRYHPAMRAAKALVEGGELGRIVWVRGRYGKPAADEAGWRADPRRSGGGILIDQGIHLLDLLLTLCGSFDEVHAVASSTVSSRVEDDLMALLRTPEGVMASLHSSNTQWAPLFSLEIGLTGGLIAVDGLLSRTGRYGPERLEWGPREAPRAHQETFAVDDSWALEIEEFVRAARGEGTIEVGSADDALRLMGLVEALYDAAGIPRGLHRSIP